MPTPQEFILGEFPRTVDDRHRISIPQELVSLLLPEALLREDSGCILAKERPGCLSLWNASVWQTRTDQAVDLVKGKMRAGKLEGRLDDVQRLARLLSTRHRIVQLTDRSRLLIPEGFREFLQSEANAEVMVVGAGVCLEIWHPRAWIGYVEGHMSEFRELFDRLSN